MRLYAGSSTQFYSDTVHNQVAQKLSAAFFETYRYQPSPAEVQSWRNSLNAMSLVMQHSKLDDHGVLLEYQLPLTSKRLDCLITGRSAAGQDNAVIVELKQWERAEPAEGANEVLVWVGGRERELLHPSAQVGAYRMYLQDGHSAFFPGPDAIALSACSYLHNYPLALNDLLLEEKFASLLEQDPIFGANDVDRLSATLVDRLSGGSGMEVLARVEAGSCRPSRQLMHHVAKMIAGQPQYVLLDEQKVVFDKVMARARPGKWSGTPTVVVVRGGPGTGKSVIAINLMAELMRAGFNTQYATGSRAFTQTLRRVLGPRAAVQFKYFNSYTDTPRHELDVLICDEAHRIRVTSNNRYTPRATQSSRPQVDELLDATKVVVFLLDDDQVVRPNEIGSAAYVRDAAVAKGCHVFDYELEAQFRCRGSEGFVSWVNNTLGIRRTANVLWSGAESFDFRIYTDPAALEAAIRAHARSGRTARMTAGFCWPWSKALSDGTLVNDVVIGSFSRPWNARPEATRLKKGIPKADLWANDPGGIDQIGCVYTAQGFEFDYVGVIFGHDLVYDLDAQTWRGRPEHSKDPGTRGTGERFVELVKNAYRVLLSRGLMGCYVCFLDKDTERFFRSRTEMRTEAQKVADSRAEPYDTTR